MNTALKISEIERYEIEAIEENLKGFFKSSTHLAEQPKESVSFIYNFVNTIKLVALVLFFGKGKWRILEYRTLKSNNSKGKHFVTIGLGVLIGDDEITLTIVNSHDGLCSVRFYLGLKVRLCNNGCVFGTFLIPRIRILHKGMTHQKINESLSLIFNHLAKIESVVYKLKTTQLTNEQTAMFLTEALKIRKVQLSHEFTTVNKARRIEDDNNSAWSTLQRVQENLTKGFTAIEADKVKSIQALRSPSSDLNMNTQLFDAMLKLVA